jgi:hypothetical protein
MLRDVVLATSPDERREERAELIRNHRRKLGGARDGWGLALT